MPRSVVTRSAHRSLLPWRRTPRLRLLAGLTAIFLCTSPAHATTVLRFDARQLIQRSRDIVHVVCTAISSGRDAAGVIVTRSTFRVVERFRGPLAGGSFHITQPGGRVGNLILHLPGMPSYGVGDELILFLPAARRDPERRAPVGLGQGVYRVERSRAAAPRGESATAVVHRTLAGLRLVPPPRGPGAPRPPAGRAAPGGDLPEQVSLEEFRRALLRRIAEVEEAEREEAGR